MQGLQDLPDLLALLVQRVMLALLGLLGQRDLLVKPVLVELLVSQVLPVRKEI